MYSVRSATMLLLYTHFTHSVHAHTCTHIPQNLSKKTTQLSMYLSTDLLTYTYTLQTLKNLEHIFSAFFLFFTFKTFFP